MIAFVNDIPFVLSTITILKSQCCDRNTLRNRYQHVAKRDRRCIPDALLILATNPRLIDLDHAGNFYYMLFGKEPGDALVAFALPEP